MTVESTITAKLNQAFEPAHLDVENESYAHNVPAGSESHFRVTLVSTVFESEGLVARHRRVYRALEAELAGPVHALALHTYTPAEWGTRDDAPTSPPCYGGEKAAD